MKILTTAIFLLVLSFYSFAQSDVCQVEKKDIIAIRGLKLGMSFSDAQSVFKPIKLSQPLNYLFKKDLSKIGSFNGVDEISLLFTKRFGAVDEVTLYNFTVSYDKTVEWDSDLEFREFVYSELNLPKVYSFYETLKCKDFKIKTTKNRIRLESTEIEDLINNEKEIKKKNFKL